MDLVRPLAQDLYETIMSGFTRTKGFNEFADCVSAAHRVHTQVMEQFLTKFKANELDEYEADSYLARALKRQSDGSDVTVQEVLDLVFAGLLAAVDTSSCALNWCLVHLALNEQVQQRLSEECAEDAPVAEMEYLNAFIREQHRVTPVVSGLG